MPRRKKAAEAEPPPARANPDLDREIAEDFQERQNMSEEGRDQLARKLRDHNALSPALSAGDVDAAWDYARESGEETFTGHAPTPDQDRVDDMGAAAGLTYKDNEPLQYAKVAKRDDRRWELDARSGAAEQAMVEDPEDTEDEDDEVEADDAPLRFWDLADDLDAEVDDEEDEDDEEDDEEEEEEEGAETVVALDGAEVEVDEVEEEEDDLEEDELEEDDLDSDLDEDLLDEDEDEDDDED
jgi:hypothetical protein